MAQNLETRAGLVPAVNEIPFSVTTEMAEEFLQKQLDIIVEGMNKDIRRRKQKKNKNNNKPKLELNISGINDDDEYEDEYEENLRYQDDVNIILVTTRMSKKFLPFYIFLPTNVLIRSGKKIENEASIFSPDNEDKTASLKNEFYHWIRPLLYPRKEIESFFIPTFRNEMDLTLKKCHEIKQNSVPRIQRFNRGETEYVAAILDPIRVFHQMLESTNEKDNFRVMIDSSHIEKIRGGNYRYDISRVKCKNKNKKNRNASNGEQLAYELSRRFNN